MRTTLILAAMLAAAAPVAAQSGSKADPDVKVQGAPLPSGWHMRLDRANADASAVKFVTMGSGYHATLGPSGIFWNPSSTASGAYTASATFRQTKAAAHPEAYGLLIGGQKLDQPDQDYLYYVIRQDGKYLIKHRAGTEVHTLVEWTEHPAIRKMDAQGQATNALSVQVGPDQVRFLANGQEVKVLERGGLNTNGIVGLRVNHNLDVHIDGPTVVAATSK